MKKLTVEDIVPLTEYEARRAAIRAMVIEHKKPRRVPVGDRVSFVFEDRQTVLFQIQEMLRVERITEPQKVAEEVEVYNDLIPETGELCATMFVEIPEPALIAAVLEELRGLRDQVVLEIGRHRVRAEPIPGPWEADRLAAVEYLKFRLPPAAIAALRAGEPAALVTEHPRYRHRTPLGEPTRRALLEDLADAPAA
ncbi:MAG TPA: DUF3501 family protein [Thermodesulfobacteriota bacterium]|nr:DUF3501 family protein [Thermodesulfobacteriota bacterium]